VAKGVSVPEFHCVTDFHLAGKYVPSVTFGDGSCQAIDFRPVPGGRTPGPLRDLGLVNPVGIDTESETPLWPNGADFDPAMLHDWSERVDAMTALVRTWERQSVRRRDLANQPFHDERG
jgi:hypothetical protein